MLTNTFVQIVFAGFRYPQHLEFATGNNHGHADLLSCLDSKRKRTHSARSTRAFDSKKRFCFRKGFSSTFHDSNAKR